MTYVDKELHLEEDQVCVVVLLGEEVAEDARRVATADLVGRQAEVETLEEVPQLSREVVRERPTSTTQLLLTRLSSKAKHPDGKWTKNPVRQFVIYMLPALLIYLSVLVLNTFTQSVDNLFHSFIVLCENEHFLMSNLH